MSRVILLLPSPDVLQLANCHKYVARGAGKGYENVYTTSTITGTCANVDKILVIGHGKKGDFETATVDDVANAIFDSGISLTGNKKVAFDTCYAGYSDTTTYLRSALYQVGLKLKGKNKACNLMLVGATGPTVTIGSFGYSVSIPFVGRVDLSGFGGADKRVVVQDSKVTTSAGPLQAQKTKQYNVNLFFKRPDWIEGATSQQIKVWAQTEYSNLVSFAIDFRSHLGADLDTTDGRKVSVSVATIV
jgi:hypothetical protein